MKFWSKKIIVILLEFQFKSVSFTYVGLVGISLLLYSVFTFLTVTHFLLPLHCSFTSVIVLTEFCTAGRRCREAKTRKPKTAC